ncbi:MAG TPA: LUD domain-containing protein [Candidatus Dormibacteraeota bacterium]|nr:LUD domain-containing protein [Candidatus Dormibacteraeota bacterium]
MTDFTRRADDATIEKVAGSIRAGHLAVRIVDTGADARALVLELVPEGAEVHSGKSKTLQDIGAWADLFESGRYDSVRARYLAMDRQTQGREIRKLSAAPDYMLGSVQAITESGDLVVASASASQIGPYAGGAGRLILVVGSQKIVPDLAAALERIERVVFPYEDAMVKERMNIGTFIGKILIIRREWIEGRVTVILVREPVGV